MINNNVVVTPVGVILNDINYGELKRYTVDGHVVYSDGWRLHNTGLDGILGEATEPVYSELTHLNTAWHVAIGPGNVSVVYMSEGCDVAEICKLISSRSGVANVIANSRVLMRCENGKERHRATLDDYYTEVTDEEREATRFF
jgi:hypothetical protein